jgi:hypothetical protein
MRQGSTSLSLGFAVISHALQGVLGGRGAGKRQREGPTALVNFFVFVVFDALQVVLGAHTCGPLLGDSSHDGNGRHERFMDRSFVAETSCSGD